MKKENYLINGIYCMEGESGRKYGRKGVSKIDGDVTKGKLVKGSVLTKGNTKKKRKVLTRVEMESNLKSIRSNIELEELGIGIKGVNRVIKEYKGVQGVYILVNGEKNYVYVGSSKNISVRMKGYKSGRIHNSRMSREVLKNGWSNFIIYVVRVEGDKRTLLKCEYGVMRILGRQEGVNLYNRFISEGDKQFYAYLLKKGVKNWIKLVNRNKKKGLTGELGWNKRSRLKLSKLAKKKGYGLRLRSFWFNKGEEHINARKIRIIDIETGKSDINVVSNIARLVGCSEGNIRNYLNKNMLYKGKYWLEDVREGKKEIIMRDIKTGSIKVGYGEEIINEIKGTHEGIRKAIRLGRIYKKRYDLKYILKGGL